MVKQHAVFLQFYLKTGAEEEVAKLLDQGGNPSLDATFFSFKDLTSVHFARWLVVPKSKKYGASIIYSANIDGEENDHLDDLVKYLSSDLEKIFKHCNDYPSGATSDGNALLNYLKSHSKKTPTFYVGAPNRSVEQINNEARLYEAVKDFVHKNGSRWSTSKEAYNAIKDFVANDPQWDWARQPFSLPKINWLNTILFGLLILLLLPLLIVGIICIHFFYELRSKPFGVTVNQLPPAHLTKMKSQEDIIYQNQLSQVFDTKGGLRKLMLKFILKVTDIFAHNIFVKGSLFGTPTIHFARWVFIDDETRFVFFSNFDGSFDEYLGDFVDNNGWGLNAIYGAAKGYPRTFFMFGGGAYKILEFMGWGRKTQVQTQIWYSAYPWDGLPQIVSRSKLRVELFNSGELSDKEIKEMLRRI